MSIIKKFSIIALIISLSPIAYSAKEYWLADIRVENIKVTNQDNNNYTCQAIIASSHDDDARNAKAFIMLAPETTFVSSTIKNLNLSKRNDGAGASCKRSKTRSHFNSYVICNLGNLSTSAKIRITIKGHSNSTRYKPACSVFVISSTPDANTFNNFKRSQQLENKI